MTVSIDAGGTFTAPQIDSADTATGWTATKLEGAGGAPSLLASVGTIDLVAEGTDARAARTNKQRVSIEFTGTSLDFTPGSTGAGTTKFPDGMVYIWAAFLAAGSIFTKANGGMQIYLSDGTNSAFWNVAGSDTYSGGLVKWAINVDLNTRFAVDDVGTVTNIPGNVTRIGFVTDVGGNTTRFDNFVVDSINAGLGLTFTGPTVGDALFVEAANADAAGAVGVLKLDNGIVFCQGNVEFNGTAQVSSGETLVFTDTVGSTVGNEYIYKFNVTGTQTFNNSSIRKTGIIGYDFSSAGATSFVMSGGAIDGFSTFVNATGQTFDGVVLQSGGTSTINNTMQACTFNLCDTITTSGVLDTCVVNDGSGTVSVSASDTNKVPNCTINKGTNTNHAFELTGATKGTAYDWSCATSGYVAGTSGNGVQITGGAITGNETIYIPATTGTFEISVVGVNTPSVATGGAIVNVTAGNITVEVIVRDNSTGALLSGARVYLIDAATKAVVYINAETDGTGRVSVSIPPETTDVVGWVRQWDLVGTDYTPKDIAGTISSTTGLSISVRLDPA